MSRHDPIREQYFRPVEVADRLITWTFYAGALLSLLPVLVERQEHPVVHTVAWIGLCLAIATLFAVSTYARLFLMPRADEKRRLDFFSEAFDLRLTYERTDGYYNNRFKTPLHRVSAQLLENSLFSKSITTVMITREAWVFGSYFVIWFVCLLSRNTGLETLAVVSQLIFSEQVASRLVRLFWLRQKFVSTFDQLFALFHSGTSSKEFEARTLALRETYEASIASAGITFSSKLFDKMNANLSKEWAALEEKLPTSA